MDVKLGLQLKPPSSPGFQEGVPSPYSSPNISKRKVMYTAPCSRRKLSMTLLKSMGDIDLGSLIDKPESEVPCMHPFFGSMEASGVPQSPKINHVKPMFLMQNQIDHPAFRGYQVIIV